MLLWTIFTSDVNIAYVMMLMMDATFENSTLKFEYDYYTQ